MGSPHDKQALFALLFDAKEAIGEERAAAWEKLHAEIDRVRAGTPYSRGQVKELLNRDRYFDYAKRRRLIERPSLRFCVREISTRGPTPMGDNGAVERVRSSGTADILAAGRGICDGVMSRIETGSRRRTTSVTACSSVVSIIDMTPSKRSL